MSDSDKFLALCRKRIAAIKGELGPDYDEDEAEDVIEEMFHAEAALSGKS